MEVMLAKIVVTHLSTISLASSFDLSWPTAADGFFEVADSFATIDSSIISPDCVMEEDVVREQYLGSTYLQRSVVTMILPFVIVPFLAFMWLVVSAVVQALRSAGLVTARPNAPPSEEVPSPMMARVCNTLSPKSPVAKPDAAVDKPEPASSPAATPPSPKGKKAPWWGGDHIESFGVSVIIMLFMAHVTLTRSSLSLLTCVDIGNGNRYMLEDLAVECGTSDADRFQYGVGLMGFLFYGIGIPVLAFVVLYRRRHALTKPRNMRVYGFIYSGFKSKWYYWESLVSLRKVGISFAAIFLGQVGPFTQALAAQLILVIAAVIHARARPYTRVLLNNMESLSIGVSLVTFIGGLYLFSEEASSSGLRTLLTTIIIGSNAVFLLLAAYFIVATMMGWHKVHWVGKTLVDEAGDVLAGDAPAPDTSVAGRTASIMKSMRRMVFAVNATMTAADGHDAAAERSAAHEDSDSGDESATAIADAGDSHLKRASLGLGVTSGLASRVRVVQASSSESPHSGAEKEGSAESLQLECEEEQQEESTAKQAPPPQDESSGASSRPASTGHIDVSEVERSDCDAKQAAGDDTGMRVDTSPNDAPGDTLSPPGAAAEGAAAPPDTPLQHHVLDFAPSNPHSLNSTSKSAWESKSE